MIVHRTFFLVQTCICSTAAARLHGSVRGKQRRDDALSRWSARRNSEPPLHTGPVMRAPTYCDDLGCSAWELWKQCCISEVANSTWPRITYWSLTYRWLLRVVQCTVPHRELLLAIPMPRSSVVSLLDQPPFPSNGE